MADTQATESRAERDVLVDLCEENEDILWTGPGGLFERAADDIAKCRSMLRRAMEHGVNGNAYYHALRAGDLGDEIKAYLQEHPI